MDLPPDPGISLPALLRAGRSAYSTAIREALAAAGLGDIPGNGIYLIGFIARGTTREVALGDVLAALGVSKQAGGKLVDTLVVRGYLVRAGNPGDRRRIGLVLSERGHAASRITGEVVRRIDARLLRRVGPESLAHARAVLHALASLPADQGLARGNCLGGPDGG